MKPLNLALTVEQEFQLRLYEDALDNLTLEDAKALILELSRQLMIKNNLLIQAMKGEL